MVEIYQLSEWRICVGQVAFFNLTLQERTVPEKSLIYLFTVSFALFGMLNYTSFMPNFIRNYVAGGIYFFTLVTSKRTRFFENKRCVEAFFSSLFVIQSYHHFDLVAYCILPDHIHLLITLAETDHNFSLRIKEIKKKTTFSIRKIMENPNIDVWQGRFWEHTIKDQDDFQHCFDYIHYNPVKHGYSDTFDWKWSSYWSYYGKDSHALPVIDPKEFHEGLFSYGE